MSQETAFNPNQPTYLRKEPGVFESLITWFAGLLVAPFVLLAMDSAGAVRRRAQAGEDDGPTGGIRSLAVVTFPILLAAVAAFSGVSPLVVLVPGLLILLGTVKRAPARILVPYPVLDIFKDTRNLPIALKIFTGIALLATLVASLPSFDNHTMVGLGFLAGYPAAIILGRRRIASKQQRDGERQELTRLVGISLQCTSEAQAAELGVYSTGDPLDDSYRVRTGELPLALIGRLDALEENLSKHAPHFEVESASAAGIVLRPVSEETRERRAFLAASGGLLAGDTELVQDVQTTKTTDQDWDF
ncbi:hypothetical protein [Paeniglutamicibacter sp.]|uniref:hypothetical protein n=1 Tax=Paeniglutamicibacter sp. TaxID=1934391 RepID=UPI003989D31E